ncbi:SLC25A21 [Lepeophtheirus salmonis]|uniref:Mitochondrial 2-oxodicarboxylate carrier n=1 Tax=Lepeophtheirus salmonis TaxID=72036 RepID=A0A7R8H5D0_LEPSM|nr:SLC25A21 [Lepeophtheirus salmonis]CAF2876416.1 SLC25A21 [Lepeophtheirus salmonis]
MSDSTNKFIKHLGMQLVAGGSAGCLEVSLMHPLDLIKTRHEGLISFWKGVVPPILVETPKRAWKFCTFEQFKKILIFSPNQPSALTYSLAGLGSGITEAIIVNPFEVVKVSIQSNRQHQSVTPSTFSVARSIIKENGLLGNQGLLTKGITGTMGRNGVFNMVYFGFYHSVKEYFPPFQDTRTEFIRKLCIGFVAGTTASCFNIPFDVAKSRIQGPQPVKGQVKYMGTLRSIALVAKEEGVLALYKGILPKILRLGPGGAIMLLVYEHVYDYLKVKYPD